MRPNIRQATVTELQLLCLKLEKEARQRRAERDWRRRTAWGVFVRENEALLWAVGLALATVVCLAWLVLDY